jgi:3-oxoacyl-[acyl-carrier protein] reductase
MRFKDRVVIVTGGASGIGRATALAFAGEGARVVVADLNEAGGQETVRLIGEAGGEAVFAHVDVSREDDCERMVRTAVSRFGGLDILFNNAGIPMGPTPADAITTELFDRIFAVNVRGVFVGCKYAIPVMRTRGGGVIINTASTAGIRPRPGMLAYAASKGAVITLTKALALELAPYGIRVNAVAPVATDTPMLPVFFGTGNPEEARRRFLESIPLGRLNTPEDIARAVLFLASDEAAMITGVCLEVDGGRCI